MAEDKAAKADGSRKKAKKKKKKTRKKGKRKSKKKTKKAKESQPGKKPEPKPAEADKKPKPPVKETRPEQKKPSREERLDLISDDKSRLLRLIELEVEEKSLKAGEFVRTESSRLLRIIQRWRRWEVTQRFSTMPEPLKVSAAFILLSMAAVVAGMMFFYLVLFLTYNPSPVSVEAQAYTILPDTTHTTTTSTTSTSTTVMQSTSTTLSLVCNPPYMRFGLGCCLDSDGNGICDSDETAETTSTTTLRSFVLCKRDGDCGPTRVEYECRGRSLYRLTITHFCRKPGSTASTCETAYTEELVEECRHNHQCYIGDDGVGVCKPTTTPNNFMT